MDYEHGIGITESQFRHISAQYARAWGVAVCAAGLDGRVVHGEAGLLAGLRAQDAVEHLVGEGLRWGEATITAFEPDRLLWAVPLMINARLLGGVIAGCREADIFAPWGGEPRRDLRRACMQLRAILEAANLTNAAYLEAKRSAYEREQLRAYYLHDRKLERRVSVQETYLAEEPALLSAIRRGERQQAVEILNRILVVIYHHGGADLDLIKSMLMELVAAMGRAALEAGGRAEDLMGVNWSAFTACGQAADEEALSHWLVAMLGRIMDAIAAADRRPTVSTLQAALRHMEQYCDQPLTRDAVAAALAVSPTWLSRLLNQHTGRGFSDQLARIRVDRACGLLRRTDRSLVQVALDCGFSDQSRFTKVFRRLTGLPPGEYRRRRLH